MRSFFKTCFRLHEKALNIAIKFLANLSRETIHEGGIYPYPNRTTLWS